MTESTPTNKHLSYSDRLSATANAVLNYLLPELGQIVAKYAEFLDIVWTSAYINIIELTNGGRVARYKAGDVGSIFRLLASPSISQFRSAWQIRIVSNVSEFICSAQHPSAVVHQPHGISINYSAAASSGIWYKANLRNTGCAQLHKYDYSVQLSAESADCLRFTPNLKSGKIVVQAIRSGSRPVPLCTLSMDTLSMKPDQLAESAPVAFIAAGTAVEITAVDDDQPVG